jgi:hypothetical protein
LPCTGVIVDKFHEGGFPRPRLARDPVETLGAFKERTKVGPVSIGWREYPFESLRIDVRDMLVSIVHLGILQMLQSTGAKCLSVFFIQMFRESGPVPYPLFFIALVMAIDDFCVPLGALGEKVRGWLEVKAFGTPNTIG